MQQAQLSNRLSVRLQTIGRVKFAGAMLLLTAIAVTFYPQSAGAAFNSTINSASSLANPTEAASLSGAQINQQFGKAVALQVTTVVAGTPNQFIGAKLSQGGAYVFAGSGAVWIQQANLLASRLALR